MFTIIFTESYDKRASKFFKKRPHLLAQYQKILHLLELNPNHSSLRLHPLQGKLKGIHSISINLQYRVTLQLFLQDGKVILLDIGDHDAVY